MRKKHKHYAKNPDYDNARKNSELALSELNDLSDKYNKMPNISDLSDAEVSWVNERIRLIGEFTKNTHYEGFKFFDWIRLKRNYLSHPKDKLSADEINGLWKEFFPQIPTMKNALEQNIKQCYSKSKKKREFEKFGNEKIGTEVQRKQLVDSLEDSFNPADKEFTVKFPQNEFENAVSESLNELEQDNEIWQYIQSKHGMSENIQTDILKWMEDTQDSLDKSNPFVEEEKFVYDYGQITPSQACENVGKTEWAYKRLPSVSTSKRGSIGESNLSFDFYKKEFEKLLQKESKLEENNNDKDDDKKENKLQKINEQKVPLYRNLKADMEKNLINRKHAWTLAQIEEMRKKFMAELWENIKQFMKIEKILSSFIDDFGRLWDLSKSVFGSTDFSILKQYAQILQQDESLMELAKILGKNNRVQALYEKEERDKVVIKNEFSFRPAPRGQICGIKTGNDLSTVLPSEMALLSNPKLKKLFFKKFAQKELLSYKYENLFGRSRNLHEKETVDVEKKDHKGPIIICVDTSGSMHGTPENIAKTITFALSKIAIEEERKCYLISFSTDIETVQLDMTDDDGNALDRLVKFLTMSFHGGTDATPALEHAVKMLGENDWKNADVLMISDGVMPNINDDMQNLIKSEQDKNTEFYFLIIGSSANQKVIDCFDHNWLYDMSDPKASRHLVEQLDKLKRR